MGALNYKLLPMKRLPLSLAALLLAFSFAACDSLDSSSGGGESQTIGMASNGDSITIKVGDTLNVALPQNPSTGYSWHLSNAYKPALKVPGGPTSQSFKAQTAEESQVQGLVGAPKVMTWTFHAVKPGEAKIEFSYVRSWEKDQNPSETFEVTVTVEP